MKSWLTAAALLCLQMPATAQVMPDQGTSDPRIQTVAYRADQVVQLVVAVNYQLTVEFAPDERIENVALGDSAAWQATPNRRGDRLFVKPLQAGASTNMTVITDARSYVFDLEAAGGTSMSLPYTLRFTYAAPATATSVAARPIAGRYRLSGARAIRPIAMHDDGEHTYLKWPASALLPAVYAVDDQGQESLVNGMMRDDVFVIDQVLPKLVFRLDRKVARAARTTPEAKISP